MADSGARGSAAQIRQLAGMRGLDGKARRFYYRNADNCQFPRRTQCFTVLHFNTRGSKRARRYGIEDCELWVFDETISGCSARFVVSEDDCGTTNGLVMRPVIEGGDVDRGVGR